MIKNVMLHYISLIALTILLVSITTDIAIHQPSTFHKNNRITRESATECLEEYSPRIKWVKEGGRIIDIGCADGSVTTIMRKYVPRNYVTFFACDISEKMIKFAKENCADDSITYQVLDIEGTLPKDFGGFNQVFCFYLFHWIRKQEKAFSNIYQLLAGGGELLTSVVSYAPVYEVYEIMAHHTKWGSSWLKNVNNFLSPYYYEKDPVKKIKDILEAIGYINIEIQYKDTTFVIENGTALKNMFSAVEPYNMPKEVYEEFLQDTVPVAQLLGLLDKNDINYDVHKAPIQYKYKIMYVYASKPKQ